jgi:hypothetical protein
LPPEQSIAWPVKIAFIYETKYRLSEDLRPEGARRARASSRSPELAEADFGFDHPYEIALDLAQSVWIPIGSMPIDRRQ